MTKQSSLRSKISLDGNIILEHCFGPSVVEIWATESIKQSPTQKWMDECPGQNEVIKAIGML